MFEKLILIYTFIYLPFIMVGQDSSLYQQSVDQADEIIQLTYSKIVIDFDKDDLKANRFVTEERKVLKPSMPGVGKESIQYSTFSRINDIETALKQVDKKNFKRIDTNSIVTTHDVMLDGIFHSGYKKKKIQFNELTKNSVYRIKYKEKYKDLRLLDPFYFLDYKRPIETAIFEIEYVKGVDLKYDFLGSKPNDIEFTSTVLDNGNTLLRWERKNIPSAQIELGAPSFPYWAPHIIPIVKGYIDNDKYVTVLDSEKSLYKWYVSFMNSINKNDDTELKNIVANLIEHTTTDEEKIDVIFDWVQEKINYIAFEEGMRGFVPAAASEVCTKKFGDCKDMANLLANMLRHANLPASVAWVGTRDKPYSYYDVYAPIVDNHMIAVVKKSDGYFFLDPTSEFIDYTLPSPFTQGKEALIYISDNEFDIVKVPIINGTDNKRTIYYTLNIEDKNIVGTVRNDFYGYHKLNLAHAKKNFSGNQISVFWQNYLEPNVPNFHINNIQSTEDFYSKNVYQVAYDYQLNKYVKSIGERIIINPHFEKFLRNQTITPEKRTLPFEREANAQLKAKYVMSIPEGFSVEYLPKSNTIQNDLLDASFTYKQEGKEIIIETTVTTKSIILSPDDCVKWNSLLSKLNQFYSQTIVLKK